MMIQEMTEKFGRMNDRLAELKILNENIARLAFYINENDISNELYETLSAQREAMIQYRDILQDRILIGTY